ncbi:MAG: glycoside hydrolase family 5 protein [Verrucomicrobiota bacterium]
MNYKTMLHSNPHLWPGKCASTLGIMRVFMPMLIIFGLALLLANAAETATTASPAPAGSAPPVSGAAKDLPIDPFQQNARLGRGINIRRMEELGESHYRAIKDAGFQHIRIPLFPFKYMKSKSGFDIQPVFFSQLDTAVRCALAHDLMVTLDLHEHKEMRKDPVGTQGKFLAAWRQIAPHCKDYPSQVVFEIANEPPMSPELWNALYPQALKIIRASNPSRTVLVGAPVRGCHIPYLKDLRLPENDRNLIATVHYYDPFAFTHQGVAFSEHFKDVSGVNWSGTEQEKKAITEAFDFAQKWSEEHHCPINMGEFGTGSKGAMEERIRWTSFVVRQMEARHWSWSFFEFDQPDFGIYDKASGKWLGGIRDTLLTDMFGTK